MADSRGGPPQGNMERPPGLDLLQDLLRRPPVEIASFALDQVKELQKPGANVESLPIFQLAGALNAAPMEQKQLLVQSAMSGFSELPASRRVEVVRLAMQSQDLMKQAEGLEVAQMAQQHYAGAQQRINDLEAQQARANGEEPPVATSPAAAVADMRSGTSPFVQNLMKVAQEAKFDEMPKEDLQCMAQVAQSEAVVLAQPQQLLDVVQELAPEEREQLTEVLIEARVVPEEQRGVLEQAVRPGGYADKLASALTYINMVREHAWILIAMPAVEFILSLLASTECGAPLGTWLRMDSLIAFGVAGSGYFAAHTIAPVYEKLKEDPMGAVQRFQIAATETKSLQVKLDRTVPGVGFDTYRTAAIGALVAVVLVILGAVWAVVGVLELLFALTGCAAPTFISTLLFIGLRFGFLVALLGLLYFVMDEVQKHRSRPVMLGGTSQIPMTEDAYPHSQMQPQRPLLGQ